jgi:uncharacterized protein YndB with AHSA1/START domain
MEISLHEEFNAPVEKVFAAFTDVPGAQKWMPNLVKMEMLTDGAYGLGTKWRETRKMLGTQASEVFEVTSFTPGKRIELYIDGSLGSSKRGEYRFTYEFQEQNGKTLMNLSGSVTGMGVIGALFGWFFKGMIRRMIKKDHEAFRKYVESA